MIVHTSGNHKYASTKIFTIGEDGKKRYSYRHWGALEDGNRFHPGTNYFYVSVAERNKLIFPPDWDMSEVSELSSTRRRGRVSYQDDDIDRQYGATWFLDKVAEVTGVKEDLLKVLGGNNEMVNDVKCLKNWNDNKTCLPLKASFCGPFFKYYLGEIHVTIYTSYYSEVISKHHS